MNTQIKYKLFSISLFKRNNSLQEQPVLRHSVLQIFTTIYK